MQQEEESVLEYGGIPMNLVKGNVDYLICPICFNLIWDPVTCGQDRCFSSFCRVCISHWLNSHDQQINEESFESEQALVKKENCPKCKREFIETEIPMIEKLLSTVEVHCIHERCSLYVPYAQFENHILQCKSREQKCKGCLHGFVVSDIEAHEAQCELIYVQCSVCQQEMRKFLLNSHDKMACIGNQFTRVDEQLKSIQVKILDRERELFAIEDQVDQLYNGEMVHFQDYKFCSIFVMNYQFTESIVRLIRNSYNYVKQKNDFLHFYVDQFIKVSLSAFEWRVRIIRLKGNLLMGICSSQQQNSVDFIINKLGEVKKKEANDNKYNHLKKVHFSFGEGDIILFQLMPLQRQLRITNETRHLVCHFDRQIIAEMENGFYSFFSLENQGDALQFF